MSEFLQETSHYAYDPLLSVKSVRLRDFTLIFSDGLRKLLVLYGLGVLNLSMITSISS
jgi:hypothetical protein